MRPAALPHRGCFRIHRRRLIPYVNIGKQKSTAKRRNWTILSGPFPHIFYKKLGNMQSIAELFVCLKICLTAPCTAARRTPIHGSTLPRELSAKLTEGEKNVGFCSISMRCGVLHFLSLRQNLTILTPPSSEGGMRLAVGLRWWGGMRLEVNLHRGGAIGAAVVFA